MTAHMTRLLHGVVDRTEGLALAWRHARQEYRLCRRSFGWRRLRAMREAWETGRSDYWAFRYLRVNARAYATEDGAE